MVLIMISSIECNCIEWPIVGVGLKAFLENIMLRDEVTSKWVEA